MDDNTPGTPSTPAGSPVQDSTAQIEYSASTTGAGSDTNVDSFTNMGSNTKTKAPAHPRGPNVTAIVVGLVSMILAGLVIAKETTGLSVDWSRLGPGAIIGIGVVMAVLGAIGLVRRHNDV